MGSSPAQAAETNETNIIVTVIEEKLNEGEIERIPEEDVTVSATGASGVVTGITDDNGVISLAVIRTDKYKVAIDVAPLPDGVTPQSNRPTELTIQL
jgi:hypothetical protein